MPFGCILCIYSPYLYDLCMTHSLEWPSLTCQWMPSDSSGSGSSSNSTVGDSVLIGTHTSPGEQNYLMIASVYLPDLNKAHSNMKYDEERGEVGGFFNNNSSGNSNGNGNSNAGKIEIKMKVKHDGEVNRARYMPQNPFWIATKGPSPEVYVFDLTKHPSFPAADSAPAPQHILRGHTAEGYGLAWDPHGTNRRVVSGSEDHKVCLWDLSAAKEVQVDACAIFNGHTDVVEDVAWHTRDPNLIGSVGDDRNIMLWDVRSDAGINNTASHTIANAHSGDINGIAFNPANEYLFATSSADKTVALWDARNLKSRMHTLRGHNDQVFQVEWCPFNESVLASCSADRRVNVWDLSRIGEEQSPEDAQDGPPELLFVHGGHTSKVSDFTWCKNSNNDDYDWTIASVSEDNILQIWQMAEEIYTGDDDDASAMNDKDELAIDELE